MLRHVSVLLLVALVGSGCTMSRDGRRGTIIAGAALTATSVLLISSGANDSDYDGVNETVLDDDWGAYMLGSSLLIAGVGLLVGGVASSEPPEVDRTVTYLPPPAPVPVAPVFAPMPGAPGQTDIAPNAMAPTQIVAVERAPLVALPELPATADVLRLAKQVRSASAHGRCDAAWIMWMDLQKLDAGSARALRDGPVMVRCAQ